MSKLNLDHELRQETARLVKLGHSSAEATRLASDAIAAYMGRTAKVSTNTNGTAVRTASPVSNNAGDSGSSVRHVGYTVNPNYGNGGRKPK